MKVLGLMFLVIVSLTGCESRQDLVINSVTKTYKIVEIKRPKHFRVSIEDVKTGETFNNLSVSKHCNNWRELELGSLWSFKEVTYQGVDGQYRKIEGVKGLCQSLKNKH